MASALYLLFLFMALTPRLAGLADVALTQGAVNKYGGRLCFTVSAAVELLFALPLFAITSFNVTRCILNLLLGRPATWSTQLRCVRALTWRAAIQSLWPQLLFGILICGALGLTAPSVILWTLPLLAGYLLAIPIAVLTASPLLGRWMSGLKMCGIPEEFDPPSEVIALEIEARMLADSAQ
jgi:membrane glycosyltransferase